MMKLIAQLKIADYCTLASISFITTAFYYLFGGDYKLAIGCMLLAILCDFFDGILARKYGSSRYGELLDAFFDVAGFLLFPISFYIVYFDVPLIGLAPCVAIMISGCLRLARFVKTGFSDTSASHYVGMPVFYIAFLPILAIFGVNSLLLGSSMLVVAFFMLSEYKFTKPKNPLFGIMLLAAALYFLVS